MLVKKYDFDYVVERLKQIIKDRGTWKDMYAATTGSTLIELMAYAVDNLGYYLERRVQELYLHTCRLESSVYHLASLLGYLPIRKYAATGTATIRLKSPRPENATVTINKGLVFLVKNLPYSIVESGVIPATPGPSGYPEVTLKVMQGTLKIEQFPVQKSEEIDYVDLSETFNKISENYLRVIIPPGSSIDGTQYEYQYATIPRPTWRSERYYSMRYYFDKLRIDFGTEGFGRNPNQDISEDGKPLEVHYLSTDGKIGNINSEVSGLHFTTRIYDSRGEESDYEVKIEDYEIITSPIVGGVDQESVNSVKLYAPRLYSTGKRAVTRLDYKYWLERHPLVTRANAWGEQEFIKAGGEPNESPIDVRNSACYTMVKRGEETEYSIVGVSQENKSFVIEGISTPICPGDIITVKGSSDNDGTYTILCTEGAVDEGEYSHTTLYVAESISSSTADGVIKHTALLQKLSESERAIMEDYIYDYMDLTVYLKYYDPIIYYIDINVYIEALKPYTASDLEAEIKKDLFNHFPPDYYDFEQTAYKSDYIRIIMSHDNVLGCSIEWYINCEKIDDDYYQVKSMYAPCIEDFAGEAFYNRYRTIFALRNINVYDVGRRTPQYLIA